MKLRGSQESLYAVEQGTGLITEVRAMETMIEKVTFITRKSVKRLSSLQRTLPIVKEYASRRCMKISTRSWRRSNSNTHPYKSCKRPWCWYKGIQKVHGGYSIQGNLKVRSEILKRYQGGSDPEKFFKRTVVMRGWEASLLPAFIAVLWHCKSGTISLLKSGHYPLTQWNIWEIKKRQRWIHKGVPNEGDSRVLSILQIFYFFSGSPCNLMYDIKRNRYTLLHNHLRLCR